MLPWIVNRLGWSAGTRTQAGVAGELGVSQSTISRYLTGITEIPKWRESTVVKAYERIQYEQFRIRGLSPQSASRYRRLTPETTDQWLMRLDYTVDKFAAGVAPKLAKRDGLDWGLLSFEEQEGYLAIADRKVREGLNRSQEPISNIEEGIT